GMKLPVALGAGLRKLGARVPEDVSLLNLGGSPEHCPVEFTSFAMPMTEMVRQAMALLLADDAAQPAVQAMYRSELRQGETTAPPQPPRPTL
ncbi:MAG TPA: substrate-binding domain-containing protein, partial [Candidatus Brocadiia bacterium]|nr:substrate-binding domain-containing protein [Candidatus Brocadiia bacterium]